MKSCSIIFFFLGIIAGSLPLKAQTNWQWARSGGGKGKDQPFSIAADNTGNVFVAGFYADSAIFSGTMIRGAREGNNFFLAKYSPGGSLVWIKTSTVKGLSYATGLCVAQNKYLYVTGSYTDSVSFGNVVLSSKSLFIAQYDLDGNVIWAKSEDASGGNLINSVSSDAIGNAYVCGSFSATANFEGAHLTSAGGIDIFLVKFSPDGSLIWAKRFGSTSDDEALAIACSQNGDFAVTGSFGSTLSFGATKLSAQGTSDVFIAKFSSDGTPLWAQQSGDTSSGAGQGIAMDTDESVYVTGSFGGYTPEGCDGYGNIYIAKYSADGIKQWATCAGSGGEQSGNAITADKLGNIFVTGQYDFTIDFGTGPLPISGIGDMFIAEFNPSGVAQWADHAGSKGAADFGNGVALDSSRNLYLAGAFTDTVSFGPFIVESVHQTDAYLAKIGFPLGVAQENNSSQQMTLYPNPAQNEVHIIIYPRHSGNSYIEIFSLLGETVKKITISNSAREKQNISIPLTGFSPGTYLCRYNAIGDTESGMFIIK
jgi:hypothetical protein